MLLAISCPGLSAPRKGNSIVAWQPDQANSIKIQRSADCSTDRRSTPLKGNQVESSKNEASSMKSTGATAGIVVKTLSSNHRATPITTATTPATVTIPRIASVTIDNARSPEPEGYRPSNDSSRIDAASHAMIGSAGNR